MVASGLTRAALRIPIAFTRAPTSRRPAPTSIARWNDDVVASRTKSTSCGSAGVFNGLTRLRKLVDVTSSPACGRVDLRFPDGELLCGARLPPARSRRHVDKFPQPRQSVEHPG